MAERPRDSALNTMIQSMSGPQGAPVNRAPRIPAAVAVPLVLLVAGAGAWFVYRYGIRGSASPVADVVQLDEASMRMPGGFGSVQRQRGAINVRGMDYQLRATRSGDGAYRIVFDYPPHIRQSWVTGEQWELHQVAQRATSIPKFARHINLTDEQRRQIQALPVNVELTAAEVQKLRPYLSDWDRATDEVVQRSAQPPLLDAAQAISASKRAAAQAAQRRRVQELAKIITPEQRKLAETYILPAAPAAASAEATPPSSP
jgi:hypothetical protein